MKQFYFSKLFFIGVMLFVSSSFAQTVTGVISDANGPLPGVNVLVEGTSNGTSTDFDGKYTIDNIAADAVLVVSYIGYITQEVLVNGRSVVDVVLLEDAQALDEVVLVGYSTRKKSSLTGAVALVNMSDMEKTRVPTVSQALQGQIAGVTVSSSTGAPGDPIQIRIRGEGTIGNNNPLFVIDGIPTRDITFLNQADVKTMTVLKDAAAAAMYGSRAAGGVVLITTKSGVKGKTSYNVDFYTGVHTVSNLPNLLNGEQYINTVEKAWNNANPGNPGANPFTADRGTRNFANTDWLDKIFDIGYSQNLQLSASGGNDKVQYLMSLGYYDQNGIIVSDKDKFQRLNYRTNLNLDITDRFKTGVNLQISQTKQDLLSSKGDEPGIIRHALLRPPVLSVFKDVNDPTYSESDPYTDLPFFFSPGYDLGIAKATYELTNNPVADIHFADDVSKVFKMFGNIYGEYSFLENKELTFRTNVGIELSFFHDKAFFQTFGDDDGNQNGTLDEGFGRRNRPNRLVEQRGEEYTVTFNNTLNYVKTFNDKHDFNALIGTEYITNKRSWVGGNTARFPFDDNAFRYLDFGGSGEDFNTDNFGSATEWSLFSYFGSASYAFDNKYFVTANLRADASSRFSENNRWGYFPSISAGWMLSKESFLSDVDWLSSLKLRTSWGQLGNQEIVDYAFLTLISQENGIITVNRFGNPDLKWETSTQTNIGLDVGLFNNKLGVTMEYFDKNTTDILLPVALSSIAGQVEPTIINAGEVSNKGFEFSLNYRNSENEFKYNLNVNFATLKNNVEKLHPNVPVILGLDKTIVSRTEVGEALNSYYGYRMIGIYQDQSEIDSHLSGTPNNTVQPGDIKFNDLNGDGIIDADDREFLGSNIPDLTYALNFSSTYKNFDFSILFQGVGGVDRFNEGKKAQDFDTRPFNYTTSVLNAWDGPGSSNTIPRVSLSDTGVSKISSLYVEDASYLRLKNIELGYNTNFAGNDVRFYVSGQNLFTITDYEGLDPESTDTIDFGTYPSSVTILFGLNFKF